MNVFLMYRDRDFDPDKALPWNASVLRQDLELDTLFDAMARGDGLLLNVAKQAILNGVGNTQPEILYRQAILKDCLENAATVRDLYTIADDAIAGEKKTFFFGYYSKIPSAVLDRAVEVLRMFVGMLKRLRTIADASDDRFASDGFKRFFAMIQEELSDDYFAVIEEHLDRLRFRNGVLVSAALGKGGKGVNETLRKPPARRKNWLAEMLTATQPATYTIRIADRDVNGAKALAEMRDKGVNLAANVLAQSTDHILSFFVALRAELAFYIGCLNLHERVSSFGAALSFPLPVDSDAHKHNCWSLYDVCLALTMGNIVVGNDLHADGKSLVVITGANQGGKSTFLRAIGLAQLMMQAGMFVPADSYSATLCDGLFTHYKREEDVTMNMGKLDEELNRMSAIVDHLTPGALLLCNESFAATNEREGSEISRQIVCALVEQNVRVFFVTHLYTFARAMYDKHMECALFLQAGRSADGRRTFRLAEGEPTQTSYGEDLYRQIFGADTSTNGGLDGNGRSGGALLSVGHAADPRAETAGRSTR